MGTQLFEVKNSDTLEHANNKNIENNIKNSTRNTKISREKSTEYRQSPGLKTESMSNDFQNQKRELYMAIPLILIVAVVPLIIFVKEILNYQGNIYWNGNSAHYDLFSYYKMVFLLLLTFTGIVAYTFIHRDKPFNRPRIIYYIPLGVFNILVLLSAAFSEYKQISFFGFLERFEGAFVLLAYSLIMFLAMNIFKSEKIIKTLFVCLLSSAAVISVIGTLQYFGINIFNMEGFQRLVTPASLDGGTIISKFDAGTVYSTLYNPNYVGSYMAMVLPVILVLIVYSKKIVHELLLGVLLGISMISLVGSNSRAGFIGIAAAVIVLLVMYRKKIWKHKRTAVFILVLMICSLTLVNIISDGAISNRVVRLMTLYNKVDNDEALAALNKTLTGLNDVRMDKEKAELVTDNGTVRMVAKAGSMLELTDEDGNELDIVPKNDMLYITDERFSNIGYKITEEGYVQLFYNDYKLMDIFLTNQGLISPSNLWLTYRNGRAIESIGFKGYESIGSNRGYIWSRTLPLLKNTVIIGNGPDTFALYFPQYDFLNKLKLYETGSMFVDKAHSMYLQTALNTGVLSLIAMLAIFGIYIALSIKTYWKEDFASFLPIAGVACFAAVCGYIVAELFNDSVVSIAPVFWVLLGVGIGINVMLGKRTYSVQSL